MAFFPDRVCGVRVRHIACALTMSAVHAVCQTDGIAVAVPEAGARFAVGDSMEITWVVPEELSLSGVVVDISPDNGLTYATIKGLNRNTRSYVWAVDSVAEITLSPDGGELSLISDSCILRVRDYENANINGTVVYIGIVRDSDAARRMIVAEHVRENAFKTKWMFLRGNMGLSNDMIAGAVRIDGRTAGCRMRMNAGAGLYLSIPAATSDRGRRAGGISDE